MFGDCGNFERNLLLERSAQLFEVEEVQHFGIDSGKCSCEAGQTEQCRNWSRTQRGNIGSGQRWVGMKETCSDVVLLKCEANYSLCFSVKVFDFLFTVSRPDVRNKEQLLPRPPRIFVFETSPNFFLISTQQPFVNYNFRTCCSLFHEFSSCWSIPTSPCHRTRSNTWTMNHFLL